MSRILSLRLLAFTILVALEWKSFYTSASPSGVDETVLRLMNMLRRKHGNPNLVIDEALKVAAKTCAEELVATNIGDGVEDNDPSIEQRKACQENETKGRVYFSLQEEGPTDEDLAYDSIRNWMREGDRSKVFFKLAYIPKDRHFSQLLWAGTTKVGCAVSEKSIIIGQKKVFACYFNPPQQPLGVRAFKVNLGAPN